MKQKENYLDKIFKISLISGILLISLSASYYFVIFLPQNEQTKIEQEKIQQENISQEKNWKRIALDGCLQAVEKDYQNNWNTVCTARGLEKECSISNQDLQRVETIKKDSKDDCYSKYPLN